MKATYLSVVTLALLGACATQEDQTNAGLCNPRSADCNVAGASAAGAGTAGASVAGADAGGASGTGTAGAAQAGAAQAGAAQGGSAQAGAAQGGAAQAGAAQGGAAQAGAAQGGAAQAGAGGAPATGTVVIQTNRDKGGQRWYLKVVAPDNYVQWAAATVADAEKFAVVSAGTNLIKLRATSINKFVALDQTGDPQKDYLVANATEATAAIINNALCAATNTAVAACAPNCRGMQVMGDDDVNNFVVSDDQFTLATGARARSAGCGTGSTAWESWQFITQ